MSLLTKTSILGLVIIIYTGCLNPGNNEKTFNVRKYAFLDSISCDSCLYLLVQSADIDTILKNKPVTKDGIENGSLLIKIYHENEVESDAVFDAADGFLNIDLKHKKLYSVIMETDSLKEVKCDNGILNYYVLHCAM